MKFKRFTNFKIEGIILLFILAAGFILRFYNVPNRWGFDVDPTRDALLVNYAVEHLKIPLVGAVSGIGAFNFGPWYYYQLILFKIIFPFQYSPWIYVGLTSLLAVLAMYKVGEVLEGKRFGLLLAFFMALSPGETGQTQGLSNPTLVPLFAAVTIYLFIREFKGRSSSSRTLLLGLILGIGINIHYQLVCLLPLVLFLFIFKREEFLKRLIAFLVGFFTPFISLLLFNIETHGNTITSAKYYFSTGRSGIYIPNSWRIYIFDFWSKFFGYLFGLNLIWGGLLAISTTLAALYITIKRKPHIIYLFLAITFLIDFLFLRYFLPQRDYYYYLFIHPTIFIFVGLMLWHILKLKLGKLLLVSFISLLAIFMVYGTIPSLRSRPDFVNTHNQAQILRLRNPNTNFSFYICSERGRNEAQGLLFFLGDQEQKNGTLKIGVGDYQCKNDYSQIKRVANTNPRLDLDEDLVNLNGRSDSELANEGWKKITAESVYRQTVDWWH